MTISFRQATQSDAKAITDLVGGLIHFFLDDPLSPECKPFLESVSAEATAARIADSNFAYILAENNDGLCGVAAMRSTSHLYHLFVGPKFHRQGIARELWQRAMAASPSERYTVNSSLFAVPVYSRLGFTPVGPVETKHGVTYQAMVYAADT